jgi:hypothetical protein
VLRKQLSNHGELQLRGVAQESKFARHTQELRDLGARLVESSSEGGDDEEDEECSVGGPESVPDEDQHLPEGRGGLRKGLVAEGAVLLAARCRSLPCPPTHTNSRACCGKPTRFCPNGAPNRCG